MDGYQARYHVKCQCSSLIIREIIFKLKMNFITMQLNNSSKYTKLSIDSKYAPAQTNVAKM